MTSKFNWPALPKNEDEFEKLMWAIDDLLDREGLALFQRAAHVGRKLWEAFGWGGNPMPADALADQPGYSGNVLMAKANRWYRAIYGERLKTAMVQGYAPFKIRHAIWRVQIPVVFGSVIFGIDRQIFENDASSSSKRVSSNALSWVNEITQGLANRLTDQELKEYFYFFMLATNVLMWRDQLPNSELFNMAHLDFDVSTECVLSRRYGHARWQAQQSVEKTLKGILESQGKTFPKGSDGHDLLKVAKKLQDTLGIQVPEQLLKLANCSTNVRYEKGGTEEQALQANHAALGIFDSLRNSPVAANLLATYLPRA